MKTIIKEIQSTDVSKTVKELLKKENIHSLQTRSKFLSDKVILTVKIH